MAAHSSARRERDRTGTPKGWIEVARPLDYHRPDNGELVTLPAGLHPIVHVSVAFGGEVYRLDGSNLSAWRVVP